MTDTADTTADNASLSTLTIPFTEKGRKVAAGLAVITVASKVTKDEAGNEVPAKFPPFTVVLPSSYLSPVAHMPEVFRDAILAVAAEPIKKAAADSKVAGRESVTIPRDIKMQLEQAAIKISWSAASVGDWFDAIMAPVFAANSTPEKLPKLLAGYRAAFIKSVNGTVTPADAERMLTWIGKLETSDPMTTKVTDNLEGLLVIEDMLDLD